MPASNRWLRSGRGFSLVELMVVLTIVAILAAIIVPSLVSTLPERNLAAAGGRFAADIRYCRAKAEASGHNVYLGFVFEPYQGQVDAGLNRSEPGQLGTPGMPKPLTYDNTLTEFTPPPNPGVARTCREYYIVEERPRTMHVDDKGHNESELAFDPRTAAGRYRTAPLKYVDWVNWYYNWSGSSTYADGSLAPYPVEPQFPYKAAWSAAGGVVDPRAGSFNCFAVPLVAYPQYLLPYGSTPHARTADYASNFVGVDVDSFSSPAAGDWGAGDAADQQFKMFCIADEAEILNYDDGVLDATGRRFYDRSRDNARLDQTVVDYVLLKIAKLPDHVTFLNPWRSEWVVGYHTSPRDYVVRDLGFIQHLFAFTPAGEVELADWTYEPVPFPPATSGKDNLLVHGRVKVVDNLPTMRPVWMVVEECLDHSQPEVINWGGIPRGSEISLLRDAKKANLSANGRMFMMWPLNAKYYVDDYAPNDWGQRKDDGATPDPDNPDLNLDLADYYGGAADETAQATPEGWQLVSGALELGWAQNFLASPYVPDNVQR